MTTAFKLVFDPGPEHILTRVFVGPEGGALAFSGVLTMRREEWTAFTAALLVGKAMIPAQPVVELVVQPPASAAGAAHVG
jgi:hypothetical protein